MSDPRKMDSNPRDAVPKPARNYEQLNKLAGAIQSLVASVGIIVGGGWALFRFDALLEARIAAAQADKVEADAQKAKREAAGTQVVNIDLNAESLGDKWVQVELTVRNTGNESIKLDMAGKTKFFLAQVFQVDQAGAPSYGERIKLQFDYPDKTIEWFMLRPGAEIDRFRTIQKLHSPGLYIARFSVSVPDSSIGEGREYSAQKFFLVP